MLTNEQTELHQFQKQPSYDGDLSPVSSLNLLEQSVFELESGKGNVDGQRNGQKTDKRTHRITPISKGT